MRSVRPYARLGYRLNELAVTVTEAQKALSTGDLIQAINDGEDDALREDFAEMAGNFDVMLGDVVQRLQRMNGVINTLKSGTARQA